jgi:hypothetical protein
MSEEKSKLEEIMGNKISEFKALGIEKDKRIASLEAELKQAKEEYEAEENKIRQASTEAAIDLNTAQVKIEDLKDEAT